MKFKIIIIAITLLAFYSCKKQAPTLQSRLVGTWNIDKYSLTNQSGPKLTLSNYGTYTFYSDGNGYYIYSANPNIKNNFTWTCGDSVIATEMNNQKTLIKVILGEATRQQWTSTVNNVKYDLDLTKKQ